MIKNNLKLKTLLILLLVIGSSTSFLSVIAGRTSSLPVEQETSRNRGVTVLSLDQNDFTVTVCANDIVATLNHYVDVEKDVITSLEDLENSLTLNQDDFVILMGHSVQEGISIGNQLVGWDEISIITEENFEKTFIIPTCFSSSFSEYTTFDNVLTPFEAEVDFRISVDFNMLSVGYLLDNHALMDEGIDKFWEDINYFIQPQLSLIYDYDEINKPGGAIFSNANLFDWEIALNFFIVKASAGTAFGAIAMKFLLKTTPGVGISFLSSICSVVANWLLYVVFIRSLGWHSTFPTMKDLGTTGWSDIYYDDTPNGRLIYLFRYHTYSTYELTTDIYERWDGCLVQSTYTVRLELYLVQSLTIPLVDFFSPSVLWDMQLVYWSLLNQDVVVHYTPPPPTSPPPAGGGTGPKDVID